MKNRYKIVVITLCAALCSACSADYLDTKPSGQISPDGVFETVENASQAINGICQLMTSQHQSYGSVYNGEGTIKMYLGEFPGNDFSYPAYTPGWTTVINQTNMTDGDAAIRDFAWYYYYMLISNCNAVIVSIDGAAGAESKRQFIKAQALSIRAYSYTMLLEFYSARWADSNGGAARGVVLRLDGVSGSKPTSTMTQCYKQIYDDLDQAIALYTSSGERRVGFFHPNINMAYGVYARAALNREDYPTAQQMASKAYNGYELMSVKDYRAGFCTPNSEWIWGSNGSMTENLWYYSYGATMGYNGFYVVNYGFMMVANRELIDGFPNSDIRKNLFFNQSLFPSYNFDDPTLFSQNDGTLRDTKFAAAAATPTADTLRQEMSEYAAATAGYPVGYDKKYYAMYAHLKFGVIGQPGVSSINHIRSSEMYLIEAEAAYHNNEPQAAIAALVALNKGSGRDPNYSCTLSGAPLLEEIRRYRRLELWGEGFSWYDYKRWNISVKRKSFANGGTYQVAAATEIKPSDANRWVMVIPSRESDFNDAIK